MAKEYIEREALLLELAENYDDFDPHWQRERAVRLGLTISKKYYKESTHRRCAGG